MKLKVLSWVVLCFFSWSYNEIGSTIFLYYLLCITFVPSFYYFWWCCIVTLYIYISMQNHNDDTIKTSDTVLFEKYTSHFIWKGSKGLLKVLLWEGVGDRTELQHIDPHSSGHNSISFLFSCAAQPGAWGPSLSGCWFSLPHLISNWLNFLCTELYNCSMPTFFL